MKSPALVEEGGRRGAHNNQQSLYYSVLYCARAFWFLYVVFLTSQGERTGNEAEKNHNRADESARYNQREVRKRRIAWQGFRKLIEGVGLT